MSSNTQLSFRYNRIVSLFIIAVSAGLLSQSCKPVGPDFQAPTSPAPNEWDRQITSKLVKEPKADLETWWTLFNDPILSQLIAKATRQNKNLKTAYSRVLAARAEVAGVSGSKLPEVGAAASASVQKQSDEGSLEQLAPPNGFKPQSIFQLGINSSWEIDVFGRIRRSMESANYAYEKSIQDYYDILTILLADVAINYMDLRSQQQQQLNTELNIKAQEESLALSEAMYNAGLTSYLDVVQAHSNLSETKSQAPHYQLGEFLAINRLALLLGTTYDSLEVDLYAVGEIPAANTQFDIGLPTDLLRQRPDIRAAELNIAIRNAKTGVSTADLYPTFSLGGFFGFDSQNFNNLFTVPGMTWGLSLPVSWQILNRKRIRANIEINEEQTQQAILQYENTVLKAYFEVENLMTSLQIKQESFEHITDAIGYTEEAVGLVKVQYQSQVTDFQNVLDTQRSLFRQQNQKVKSETEIVIDLIKLYKALGGGWNVAQDSTSIRLN